MSEKRFSDLNDLQAIIEELEQEIDEQQATLHKQKEEIINSHIAYVESLNEIKDLKEENEQLRRECKSNEHLCEYYRQKYKKLLEDVQENVKGELVIR